MEGISIADASSTTASRIIQLHQCDVHLLTEKWVPEITVIRLADMLFYPSNEPLVIYSLYKARSTIGQGQDKDWATLLPELGFGHFVGIKTIWRKCRNTSKPE